MAKDSSGRVLPWFKLWTKDFMADPVVQALSWDQRGRFLWGCMCSWETDSPGIASESSWIAWFGGGERAVEVASEVLRAHGDRGLLTQKRLRKEFIEAKAESDRNLSRTAAASAARHVTRNATDNATDNVTNYVDGSVTDRISEVRSQKSESKSKSSGADAPGFMRFWELYPKKTGRKPCSAKWKRANLESKTEAILAGLSRIAPTWNPGFEPNPLTFLNQERWNDEPNTNGHAPESDGWEVTR